MRRVSEQKGLMEALLATGGVTATGEALTPPRREGAAAALEQKLLSVLHLTILCLRRRLRFCKAPPFGEVVVGEDSVPMAPETPPAAKAPLVRVRERKRNRECLPSQAAVVLPQRLFPARSSPSRLSLSSNRFTGCDFQRPGCTGSPFSSPLPHGRIFPQISFAGCQKDPPGASTHRRRAGGCKFRFCHGRSVTLNCSVFN